MDAHVIIDIFARALWVIVILVSTIILPGLIVGLMVAMFQAATQINEMTLNFIPRLLVTIIALIVAAPWMIKVVVTFTESLIHDIPYLIG